MLSPRLTNCPECADIPSLLKKIDCKLAELGNNLYNNISYMLNKPIPAGDILQLIGYRRILTYKYCNPNYVHKYSVQMIASRVIRLTAGCVSRCNEPERCLEDPCEIDIVANPTTTSTTTLTTCQSYILYNTATSAESFLIGNCITGEPQTITLQGLSSVCISTIVALNVSPNIVVINTNECTTTTTSTSSTSSTTTTSTTAVPTTTTTSSSSTSTTTSTSSSTTTSTSSSTTTTTTSLAPTTTTTTTQSSISWNGGFANTGPSGGWLWNACNNPDETIIIYTANNVISPFPPNTPIYTDPGLTTLLYPSSTVAISILGFAYTVINGYTNPLGGSGQDCQFITTTTTTTLPPTTTTTSSSSTSTTTSTSSSTSTTTSTTTVDPCLDCVAHDLTIGTQTWTGCNLDVTTFRNGDPIPEVTDPSAWVGLTTPAWCYYENDSLNGPTYGKLYNWFAVNDPRGLAPVGYHIPSDTEWTTLTTYLGGSTVAGGALKQQGFCHWLTQNTATNSSGFSGLPGGYRSTSGLFFGSLGTYGNFWSTSQYDPTASYFLSLYVADNSATIQVANNIDGQSVRLIKD